jgi:hypothetical protein
MDVMDDTQSFVIDLFCRVDAAMEGQTRHPQAALWPSELVTLGLLFVIKGRPERAFYRWARRDLLPLFPRLPERTRFFRLLAAHYQWTERFLAEPTPFGVADSYGIELIQTRRLGRSPHQIARRGYCAGRWIAGVKLGWVINSQTKVCAWDAQGANVYDANAFAPLISKYADRMIVLADCNFHKSPFHRKNDPDPPNLKICPRNQWNERRIIETAFSLVTGVFGLKHLTERAWPMLRAHLAFAAAAFNLLIDWTGTPQLALARFSL